MQSKFVEKVKVIISPVVQFLNTIEHSNNTILQDLIDQYVFLLN